MHSEALYEYIKVIVHCNKSHPLTRSPKDLEAVGRSSILIAMYQCRAKCSGMHGGHVTCCTFPAASKKVVANKVFKAGELHLQCFSSVVALHTGERSKSANYAEVDLPEHETMVYKVSPNQIPTDEKAKLSVCPFFLVGQIAQKFANCACDTIEVEVGGDITVRLPMLKNRIHVNKGDTITAPTRE